MKFLVTHGTADGCSSMDGCPETFSMSQFLGVQEFSDTNETKWVSTEMVGT
jgi:hypothetical protein